MLQPPRLVLSLIIHACTPRLSSLPKSSKPDRIRENADVYDFSISPEDMAKIDALDKGDAGACQWNPIHAE